MDSNSILKVGNALQHEGGGIQEQILIPVRVVDIILDINHSEAKKHGGYDAIGTIFYAEVNIKEGEQYPQNLRTSKPMFQFIKQYPLKNEIVSIISSPGANIYNVSENAQTYYLPNFNIWNHPHHNALPDMRYFNGEGKQVDDYEMVDGGLVRTAKDKSTEIPLGDYFQEKLDIQPLLPFEGDTIIEGRFGNSIRLGANTSGSREKTAYSTEGNIGDPITIIRNGQMIEESDRGWEHTVENINTDHSSIYLMSNQKMPNIKVASTNWESWNAKHDELDIDDQAKGEFDNLTIGSTPEKVIVPDPLPEVIISEEDYTDDYAEDLKTPDGMCQDPETEMCAPDELSIYDDLMAQDNFEEDEFSWGEYDIEMYDEELFTREEVQGVEGPGEESAGNCPDVETKGNDQPAFLEFKALPKFGATEEGEGGMVLNRPKFRKSVNWNGKTYYHGTPIPISAVPFNWRKSSTNKQLGNAYTDGKNSKKTHLCIHTTAGGQDVDGWGSIHRHLTGIDCKSGRPWSVGGYHWMINPFGLVQQQYADDARCSGVGPGHPSVGATNTNSIQLNWIGGAGSSWNMTILQGKTLLQLLKIYVSRYPNIKIYGHNQVASVSKKTCPIFSVPVYLETIGCPIKNRTTVDQCYSGGEGYHKGKYANNAKQVASWSGKW